jgi:hypothetical protein
VDYAAFYGTAEAVPLSETAFSGILESPVDSRDVAARLKRDSTGRMQDARAHGCSFMPKFAGSAYDL